MDEITRLAVVDNVEVAASGPRFNDDGTIEDSCLTLAPAGDSGKYALNIVMDDSAVTVVVSSDALKDFLSTISIPE